MQLLLISNSGRPYLKHCQPLIENIFTNSKTIGFVAWAAFLPEELYFERVKSALPTFSSRILLLPMDKNVLSIFSKCDGVMIGGGNTYKLLKSLHDTGMANAIRDRVRNGMPYVGWSAGSNVAGPTILTTNDWNVVGHPRFDAMGLVPFNINPHYKEADLTQAQFSETRDDRIAEYHQVQSNAVLGIEEQTSLYVENTVVKVLGQGKVRRFLPGQTPVDFRHGDLIPV